MHNCIPILLRWTPILALAALSTLSCKKNKSGPGDDSSYTEKVYVVGSDMSDSKQQAMIWENGTGTLLSGNGAPTIGAKSVFVTNNNVYVVGYETTQLPAWRTIDKILLWKNGILQPFSNGNKNNYPNALFVSENDVYIAGYVKDTATGNTSACIWKNGVATELYTGSNSSYAFDLCIHNGSVYAVGHMFANGTNIVVLWKDGIMQPNVEYAERSTVNAIRVVGNDIHMTGTFKAFNGAPPQLIYWKNGIAQNISQKGVFSKGTSLFIRGTDVYIAGQDEVYAAIWKNGQLQRVGGVGSEIKSIWVTAQNVYAAGIQLENYKPLATIWKDGVPQKLSEPNDQASANGLFIK